MTVFDNVAFQLIEKNPHEPRRDYQTRQAGNVETGWALRGGRTKYFFFFLFPRNLSGGMQKARRACPRAIHEPKL